MKLEELFPACYPGSCPFVGCKDKKSPHHHILPQQKEFLDATEKYVALIGGFGSAKTLPVCIMGHLLSVAVPGNRGIVVRRSLPKLHDSTEQIYLEVLKRSGVPHDRREVRDGWPGRIIYANGSEVVFRETKDLGRFLGPEYGWFYIDEAQEEPEKTFKDLVGRLRLPRASKYLRGFITTNPPSKQHWIAKLWPEPGTYNRTITLKNSKKVTNTYRMIRSSTYDNPFVTDSYIAGILENNTEAEARRIIEGYYGFQQDGPPVYPTFNPMKHTDKRIAVYTMTLYRVWDWGFNCPACVWSQIFRCKHNGVHLNILQELVGSCVESEAFADQVLDTTKETFSQHPSFLILDGADAAGAEVNERGPGPIIRLSKPRPEGRGLTFRYRKFSNIDPGLDLVRKLLNKKCGCGFYLLTIDQRCSNLIAALAGGYHYPKIKPDKDTQKKPIKDGFYDNIADTLRYTAELFYRPYEQGIDVGVEVVETVNLEQQPWEWMNHVH